MSTVESVGATRADHVHNPGHGLALIDQDVLILFGFQLLAQVEVLQVQAPLFQGPVHQIAQVIGDERLGEEMEGPGFDGFHRGLDGAVAGNDDHLHLRVQGLDLLQGLQPVQVRHHQIQEDGVEGAALQQGEALAGAGSQLHLVALTGKYLITGVPHGLVIVYDQNLDRSVAHGEKIPFLFNYLYFLIFSQVSGSFY